MGLAPVLSSFHLNGHGPQGQTAPKQCESSRCKRIGHPWRHVLMNLIVCWPLPYLCWILWWPGSLRQAIFGSDREKAKEWARVLAEKAKRCRRQADAGSPH